MFVLGNLFQALGMILGKLLWLYSWIVMIAVLLSWVSPDPFNPVVRVLRGMTEPVFEWVRRRVPFAVVGLIDLSPLIVLLLLWFLQQFLVPTFFELGARLR
jgi:YggT family protein